MLPIIDYGGIALVIPKIAAVGHVMETEDTYGFEVFMDGMFEPFVIGFSQIDEAEETRKELIELVAHYHIVKEFGPDFNLDDLDSDEGDDTEKH